MPFWRAPLVAAQPISQILLRPSSLGPRFCSRNRSATPVALPAPTVINLTDKTALYNFFSTFSGMHHVTPRRESVELGFHFQPDEQEAPGEEPVFLRLFVSDVPEEKSR